MKLKELKKAAITEILAAYNILADGIGEKTLKGFKDKDSAIAKYQAMEKKVAAANKPKKEASGAGRGATAVFDYEAGERQTPPRPGTLRGRAFELLQVGTTPEDLEDLVVEFWKEKGLVPEDQKVGKRLRALELVRLLRYQNGYGFRQDKDGLVYVVGEIGGTGPKKVAKEKPVVVEKKTKKAKAEPEAPAKPAKKAKAKAEPEAPAKPAKKKAKVKAEDDVL